MAWARPGPSRKLPRPSAFIRAIPIALADPVKYKHPDSTTVALAFALTIPTNNLIPALRLEPFNNTAESTTKQQCSISAVCSGKLTELDAPSTYTDLSPRAIGWLPRAKRLPSSCAERCTRLWADAGDRLPEARTTDDTRQATAEVVLHDITFDWGLSAGTIRWPYDRL